MLVPRIYFSISFPCSNLAVTLDFNQGKREFLYKKRNKGCTVTANIVSQVVVSIEHQVACERAYSCLSLLQSADRFHHAQVFVEWIQLFVEPGIKAFCISSSVIFFHPSMQSSSDSFFFNFSWLVAWLQTLLDHYSCCWLLLQLDLCSNAYPVTHGLCLPRLESILCLFTWAGSGVTVLWWSWHTAFFRTLRHSSV